MKKSYGLNTIMNEVDKFILSSEYADKKDEVDTYANNILNNLKANYKDDQELLEALQILSLILIIYFAIQLSLFHLLYNKFTIEKCFIFV